MTERTGLFGWVRRHKLVASALGMALLFSVLNLALTLGQWDRNARSFRAGSPIEMHLDRNDERTVYLGADESEPLNFDIYPGDFGCGYRAPDGTTTEMQPARGERLLDIWREHSAVAKLVAGIEGTYVVSCEGRDDAELLVARPARFTVGWVSPLFAMLVLVLVAITGAVLLLVGAGFARLRGNREREPAPE